MKLGLLQPAAQVPHSDHQMPQQTETHLEPHSAGQTSVATPFALKKVGLVVNPACGIGQTSTRRIASITDVFHRQEIETMVAISLRPGSAAHDVAPMVAGGCDAIIACGGDGTVNEVLQGIMRTDQRVPLGVLPLGSGNLLAKELRVPFNPAAAARDFCTPLVRRLSVAVMQSGAGRARYWMVAAGIGVDARVICGVSPGFKSRFGMLSYYIEASRQLLFSRKQFPGFMVAFRDESGRERSELVTQVIISRIRYFGACLRNGSLRDGPSEHGLEMILFKSGDRRIYMEYGATLVLNMLTHYPRTIRDVDIVNVREVDCYRPDASADETINPMADDQVLTEVDGELVGTLPVTISLLLDGIDVLLPGKPGL
jgi:diacylglycerol kinase family enzyme